MKTLWVYADFDWLKKTELIGELNYEQIRGSDSYGFRFSNHWLKAYGALQLCKDLNNYPGWQYTQPGKDIFGCFSDALPDRWGRTLLHRKEQLLAHEEGRMVRRLSSFDYLTGINDYSRMGAFRLKETEDGAFINTDKSFSVQPLTSLKEPLEASKNLEKSEEKNLMPDEKWIAQLVQPGSSLGGARPKASVVDSNEVLYIAKFPSRNDDYDVELWEHLCHMLAEEAGISTASTQVIDAGERYHTLLSRRFDRTDNGRRVHFASAMSLLGLSDGDNASNGYGYLNIVDFILQNCTQVDANLQELYRRAAFNICIGNSDDHFRNHGFLLTAKGWTLSPAFDLNPTFNDYQNLLISSTSNKADLHVLWNAREEYLQDDPTAKKIINDVVTAVGNWKMYASRLSMAQREQNTLGALFDNRVAQGRKMG